MTDDRDMQFYAVQRATQRLKANAIEALSRIRILSAWPFYTMPEQELREASAKLRQAADEIDEALKGVSDERAGHAA